MLQNLYRDSLFRNSLYPMLATGVMAGLGFFFWLFSARLFTSEDIGLAATLISVMSMISALSLIGFDTATVRFLAHEEHKNASMNTGMLVIALASLVLAGGFVAIAGVISPHLAFVQTPLTALAFVVFTMMASLNMFTDAIFLAHRQTKYTLIIDTAFSLIKVVLPFAFVPWGAFGIFAAAAAAQAIGFAMSIGVLVRRFGYRPSVHVDHGIVKRVWRYSAGNYVADILNFLPVAVLPVIVTNNLGAAYAGYYYIVMMIIGLLYVIPASTMRSLFAEGSNDERAIPAHVRGSLTTTALLLLPAMLVLFVAGELILTLFGAEYAGSGLTFLYIMTLVSILVSAFALFGSLFRLTHNLQALIARNAAYAVGTITFVYVLLPHGLPGVGLAYAGGNMLGVLVSYILFQRHARMTFNDLAARFTMRHALKTMKGFLNEHIAWPLRTMIECKRAFRMARAAGAPSVTILCYPEKPRTYHTLYKLAHRLGWDITNDPTAKADIHMHFEDVTERALNDVLAALRASHRVINADCTDISKKRVNEVFEQVFGYALGVDPRTYEGPCVRKSDTNALHDGRIVACPAEPMEGYVYQKLIDTNCGDGRVVDLRIPIFNDAIPFVLKRYKSDKDLFDVTIDAVYVPTGKVLSEEERAKVIAFSRAMGLDYGEIDALRDRSDGKLYIVDVNNTPAGPIGPLYQKREELARWYGELCNALRREFYR